MYEWKTNSQGKPQENVYWVFRCNFLDDCLGYKNIHDVYQHMTLFSSYKFLKSRRLHSFFKESLSRKRLENDFFFNLETRYEIAVLFYASWQVALDRDYRISAMTQSTNNRFKYTQSIAYTPIVLYVLLFFTYVPYKWRYCDAKSGSVIF